jgi:hypothetical protein
MRLGAVCHARRIMPAATRLRSADVTQAPADRIRTLLLRADNLLKNEGDDADRARRARQALEEARDLARDPAVDPRVRELVERRLEGLAALGG